MTRKKLFMTVQAVLCAVIAVLLAADVLSLYLDGAAKQAEGDFFYDMFTRERAGAKLLPILPLLNAAYAMPQIIILDSQGVVVYNAQAPLTCEKLEMLYRQVLEH